MWPFKPAWMSLNAAKAVKAVEQTSDQETLIQIVTEAPSEMAREAAVVKLEDQSLLAKLAKTGGRIAYLAAEKVTDNTLLEEIVLDPATPSDARKAAVDTTTNQTLLDKIARTEPDHYVRLAAIMKLTNQQTLAELATTATCTGVYAAFADLVTQRVSPGPGEEYSGWVHVNRMRVEAVERLTDQRVLANVVSLSKDKDPGGGWEVKDAAINKLHDQGLLKNVIISLADSSEEDRILYRLIYKVTDKEFLASLIDSGKLSRFGLGDHTPIKAAKEKLRELNEIALKDIEKNRVSQFVSAYIDENAVEEWALKFVSAYIDTNPVKGLDGLEQELVKPFFAELFSHYKEQASGKSGLTICSRCDRDIRPSEKFVFLTGAGKCFCEKCSLQYIISNASNWHYYLGDIASLIGAVPPSLQKTGLMLQEKISQLRNEKTGETVASL